MNTSPSPEQIVANADQLMQKQDFQGAINELHRLDDETARSPSIQCKFARGLFGLGRHKEALQALTVGYQSAPNDRENVVRIVCLAIEANAIPFAVRVLRNACMQSPGDVPMLEELCKLQFTYIEILESKSDLSFVVENLHVVLRAYLRGNKINIDTLQWETMGGLAIDAAVLPKIKAAGFLSEKNPIFLSGESANPPLVNLISRSVPVATIPSLGRSQMLGYLPLKSEYFLQVDTIKEKLFGPALKNAFDDCFEFYHSTNGRAYYPADEAQSILCRPDTVTFSPEETAYAQRFMRERLNIPDGATWVCIYARDPGYYGESANDAKFFRNAPLQSFHPVIQRIVGDGGYVVRVGSATNVPLGIRHPNVIDYAFYFQDQLVDLYLIAHASLLLGSPSGLSHVAFTFNTACLNVHTINFYPSWGVLYIPKRPYDAPSGNPLTLREFFARTYDNPEFLPLWEDGVSQESKLNIKYIDNTSEEILDAYEEYMLRRAGAYEESLEERELKAAFLNIASTITGPYKIETPISTRFLRRHSYLF